MQTFSSILDSHSAMSRFRAHTGHRISKRSTTLDYILCSRLKRTISSLVDEMYFNSYIKPKYHKRSQNGRYAEFMNYLYDRIERMNTDELKHMVSLAEERLVGGMIEFCNKDTEERAKSMGVEYYSKFKYQWVSRASLED